MNGEGDYEITPLELHNLERQLLELLHELNMKRRLLVETRKELEDALLKQSQLEHKLNEEKHESEAMRLQLEVVATALQQYGEAKSASQAELSRLRVEKEIGIQERDSLRQQCHTFKLENSTLSHQIEELKSQLHCQQLHHDRSSEQEMKVTNYLDKLKNEIQTLERDKKRLERSVSTVEEIVGKLKGSHTHSSFLLEKYAEKQKKYEALIAELRAQISGLKEAMEIQKIFGDNGKTEVEDKTDQYLLELKEFLAAEAKGDDKLTNAYQKSLEAQTLLEKQEKDTKEKLQVQLQEVSKLKDSVKALTKELEEYQESNSKLQEEMKEFKAASIEKDKVECKAEGTQTGDEAVPDITSPSPENESYCSAEKIN
ncbi:hypothetical protein L9F63_018842 [Diploptera punctata]|uniref:Uncharacterized protein n=1 Tax=Diploptera punctata TaxID=6984 RepID=A0AAD7ZVL1_DIPPU|nr:hypothetical protein L9F63_018842 [Diploptera punctata]